MTQKSYYFLGRVKWAKVHEPDDKFGKYVVDFYPTPGSLEAIRESGIEVKEREDEEGTFFKFSRPVEKTIKDDLVHLGPPKVLIRDDDDNYVPFKEAIGNGSLVTCKVLIYDTRRGKGHTLEAVSVEDLVPYEAPSANLDAVSGEFMPF